MNKLLIAALALGAFGFRAIRSVGARRLSCVGHDPDQ